MFNKNSSAGTAAKNRSKSSLLARLPLLLAILLLCAVSSCGNLFEKEHLKIEYKEKHEKYRTLMYRSNFKQCFVDSCRKYGLLYNKSIGLEEINPNAVDTVTVNEQAVCQ